MHRMLPRTRRPRLLLVTIPAADGSVSSSQDGRPKNERLRLNVFARTMLCMILSLTVLISQNMRRIRPCLIRSRLRSLAFAERTHAQRMRASMAHLCIWRAIMIEEEMDRIGIACQPPLVRSSSLSWGDTRRAMRSGGFKHADIPIERAHRLH